ncbi:PEF-CTERM sorting domain-containing protein [Methanolobus psychrotolerans]|uniref:PEF-CTERM sorting domain-containing protein n=1 Tax=Methanolobus psychrotolerans TaxID=1874706 RepID=UPI000B91B2EC|nr:PEF-CTERM sorting domain-containing protein [Methanolobus psychrotolerans]
MRSKKTLLCLVVTIAVSLVLVSPATGALYRGVDFPSGAVSFADEVVDYQLNGGASSGDINKILGVADNKYVSLGAKGYAIVKFTDNSLTTSGDNRYDLAVFEAGTSSNELVEVFISTDNHNWIKIGNANRKTLFDIDAIDGVIQDERYSYVKLIDLNGLSSGASYEGADMDAVGAITSACPASEGPEDDGGEQTPVNNNIPEFPTVALPMIAILGLALVFIRSKE